MGWTIEQSQLRDDIIGKAQDGHWTNKQADKIASRLGVGPLESIPDLADYDPLQETYWSIPMTLAWIMWRDADHVREYWDDWRTQCSEWRFLKARMPGREEVKSWRLESSEPASLLSLVVEESLERADRNPPLIAETDAERVLWRHLQLGTLTATGREPAEPKRSSIPKESWQGLKLEVMCDREKNVTVPGEVVQRLWPGAASNSSKSGDNKTTQQPPNSPKKKERHHSPENDARLQAKYESVLAAGRSIRKRHRKLGPDELAARMDKEKLQGLSTETVRKIFSGRYKPMKRFGLKGIF